MATRTANDLIPTDLDDVSSIASIESLSDAELALLVPVAFRRFSTGKQDAQALPLIPARFITEFTHVVRQRATQPAVVSTVSTILTAQTTSQEEAGATTVALLRVIFLLSEDEMLSYRPALMKLSGLEGGKWRDMPDAAALSRDAIRFMDHREEAWLPQHSHDYLAARSLQERVHTAREMRPYVEGLLSWFEDDNRPAYKFCETQLARFPQLTVVTIGRMLKEYRGHGPLINNLLHFVQSYVPVGRSWESIFPQVNALLNNPSGDEVKSGTPEHAKRWMHILDTWRSSQEGLRCA